MIDTSKFADMTDDGFRDDVLTPVLEEARRRQFTLRLDPFGVLTPPKQPPPSPYIAKGYM